MKRRLQRAGPGPRLLRIASRPAVGHSCTGWTQWVPLRIFDGWFDGERWLRAGGFEELICASILQPSGAGQLGQRWGRPGAIRRGEKVVVTVPARLRLRGAGRLVPRLGHGAGQRGSQATARRHRRPPGWPAPLRQSMLPDHRFAGRALHDVLDHLGWPVSVTSPMPADSIGRSRAGIDCAVAGASRRRWSHVLRRGRRAPSVPPMSCWPPAPDDGRLFSTAWPEANQPAQRPRGAEPQPPQPRPRLPGPRGTAQWTAAFREPR